LMHELKTNMDLPDNIIDAAGYIACLQMVREAQRQRDPQ